MTAKQAIIEIANSAPDDIGWDEVQEELYLRWCIEQSYIDEENGDVYTTEQVLEQLGLCPKSSG